MSIPSEVALDMGEEVDECKALDITVENPLKVSAVYLVDLDIRGHIMVRETAVIYSGKWKYE